VTTTAHKEWDSINELGILTVRQREIVACVSCGLNNKQIGRKLGISSATVKTHLHNIFERLGISNRTALAITALKEPRDE
jgi:DNA-binding NarL/FixJ family response regulator